MSKLYDLNIDSFESIYGLNLEKNGGDMIVCKSIPLVGLSQNPMSLLEMKIFDTYLGRIHPQRPDVTSVTFEKRELEELFGLVKISSTDLKKALKNLVSRAVCVFDGSNWMTFSLLSTAELSFVSGDHSRLRAITLECSEKAKKYIYNLQSIRYLKMSLKRLVSFKSRHAYSLYQYLLVNSYYKKWDIGLGELKAILGIEGKYKDYTDFDRRVLKVAFDEINLYTELRYSYKPVLKYNKTSRIRFEIIQKDAEVEKQIETEEQKMEEQQIEEPVEPGQPFLAEEEAEEDNEFIGWDELITPTEPGQGYNESSFDEMLF